jgi:hypothetical protein
MTAVGQSQLVFNNWLACFSSCRCTERLHPLIKRPQITRLLSSLEDHTAKLMLMFFVNVEPTA